MDLTSRFRYAAVAVLIASAFTASGASITGIVKDGSGKPVENARIDHTGKLVVIGPPDVTLKPSPGEVRTDVEGHFRVVTDVPAIVVRKPGYESQRIHITGDADLQITLTRIRATSRCRLSVAPKFKTKDANDVDYRATWFYIETKDGPQGIISGSGPMYSLGAPDDRKVWTSVEYTEVMDTNGVVDASGHSADDKYWRLRSIFGAAAQYYNQARETAEQLDCVMDRVPMKLH
jgi:hypothetical protein